MAENVLKAIEQLDEKKLFFDKTFNIASDIVSSLKKKLPELIIEKSKNSWSEVSMAMGKEVLLLVVYLGLLPKLFPGDEIISKASYRLLEEIKELESKKE
jgi:hypothetical protein